MENTFLPLIFRMRYINRWSLMYNTEKEDLMQHAAECAFLTHFLATIGNRIFGKQYDAERLAVHALFHDASEVLTGDLPTPVKYYNDDIKTAFKDVEDIACHTLLDKLPGDLRPAYEPIFFKDADDENDVYLWKLVKAADKLSALIKCMEETGSGNTEFSSAMGTIMNSVSQMAETYPEVNDFVCEFLPAYGKTLDDLQQI